MATYIKLPSGKWRVQVRKAGIYRGATFPTKTEAKAWAEAIQHHATYVAAVGYAQPPKGATLRDLIKKYIEMSVAPYGKTKRATLNMLVKRIGSVQLVSLSATVLRDFIDERVAEGAGGVTIAADLSYLSAVLKWGRYARRLNLPDRLAIEARDSLKHMGLNTRSFERSREPTDSELTALNEYWQSNPRQKINMPMLVRFALATGMRLGEMASIRVEDVNIDKRTVLIRDRKHPTKKYGNNEIVPLFEDAWNIIAPCVEGRSNGSVFNVRAASISTAFTRACKALEIEDLRFHDLRHRATADFFRKGLRIPHVAVMTGHKTWAMLKRYTALNADDVHDAHARLG